MRSQADFYHVSAASHKPRKFLTLGSAKFRVSQEVWDFFSVGRRCNLKILSRGVIHKERHVRHLTGKRIENMLRG